MKNKSKANKKHLPKKTDNLAPTREPETHSILFWCMLIITGIFLLWAPYQRALFNGLGSDFDRAIITSFIWGAILLFIVAVYSFFNFKYRTYKDFLTIAVWLVPLSYLISVIGAASGHFAVNSVYIHITYAIFFILGVIIASNRMGNAIIQQVIILSGYLIVIFGLLNWLGNLNIANKIATLFTDLGGYPAYNHAVMFDSNGARLTAVFQYANSYAAYLMILLFIGLFLIVKSNKWYTILLHSLMVVPILVSFFLTLSRGALVALPVILLILLFFFSLHRQIIYILYLGLAGIASLIILNTVTNAGIELQKGFNAALSWQGWSRILLASIVYALVVWALQSYISPWLKAKLDNKITWRFSTIAIPAGSVVLGAICAFLLLTDSGVTQLLPENIKHRVENINFAQHSVLERGTFFKDSFKLWKDYPIFGAGGGGWAALYEQYQSNPYTSRQAHNFFLQYLVEVGLFGLLIFLALLAAVFVPYIKNFISSSQEKKDERFLFCILIIALLIHSAIDFNLSYVYLGLLLFVSLGSLASGIENWNAPLASRVHEKEKIVKYSFSSIMTVLSIIVLVVSIRSMSGNQWFRQALAGASQNAPYQEIVEHADKALRIQPSHPDYFELKFSIMSQIAPQTGDPQMYEEVNRLFEDFTRKEPNHKFLYDVRDPRSGKSYGQVNNFINQRNFLGALSVNTDGMNLYPWDINFYENQISILFELGNNAREENNSELTDQYWQEAFEVYNVVLDKRKQLDALPEEQLEGRPFYVTQRMYLHLGQIEFIRGNLTEAINLLEAGVTLSEKEELTQILTRWLLAAQMKLGEYDTSLFESFISNYPDEEIEIEQLANARFD